MKKDVLISIMAVTLLLTTYNETSEKVRCFQSNLSKALTKEEFEEAAKVTKVFV